MVLLAGSAKENSGRFRFSYADSGGITTKNVKIILLRFVFQQVGRLSLQRNCQLQKRRKGDVDHALLDLGDLAVIDAACVGHFPKAEPFLLAKFSEILTEYFQHLLICRSNHYILYKVLLRGLNWTIFSTRLWSNKTALLIN